MMEHMAEEILTQEGLDLRLAGNVMSLFLHWDRCDPCSGRRGFHHGACMYQHGSISRADTARQEWILLACFFSRGMDKLEISIPLPRSICITVVFGNLVCKDRRGRGAPQANSFIVETGNKLMRPITRPERKQSLEHTLKNSAASSRLCDDCRPPAFTAAPGQFFRKGAVVATRPF